MNEKETRIELVCTGAFESVKGHVVYEFHVVADGYPDGYNPEPMSWKKMRGTPGVVYSVAVPSLEVFREKGTVYTGSLRYDRPWSDEVVRLKWQEQARAVETEVAAKRQREREEAGLNELRRALKPLSSLYHKTNAQGKAALIANLVLELQRFPGRTRPNRALLELDSSPGLGDDQVQGEHMNTIEINTTEYEFSYGRKPRGIGRWGFYFWDAAKGDWTEPFFASGTYSKARDDARRYAVTKGYTKVKVGT